jgi:AcrR family transcriptional regulator
MPKLREETYAARRAHILDAARACFSRKGFHAASMLDLQAEAGVSAGAIYVYFPSKRDIIMAIAEENLDLLDRALDEVLVQHDGHPLRDALLAVTGVIDRASRGPSRGIAFDVWGETARDRAIGRLVTPRLRDIRDRFADAARRAIDAGELPRSADPDAIGAALFGACVPGYYTLRMTIDGTTPEAYVDGLLAALGARGR